MILFWQVVVMHPRAMISSFVKVHICHSWMALVVPDSTLARGSCWLLVVPKVCLCMEWTK